MNQLYGPCKQVSKLRLWTFRLNSFKIFYRTIYQRKIRVSLGAEFVDCCSNPHSNVIISEFFKLSYWRVFFVIVLETLLIKSFFCDCYYGRNHMKYRKHNNTWNISVLLSPKEISFMKVMASTFQNCVNWLLDKCSNCY